MRNKKRQIAEQGKSNQIEKLIFFRHSILPVPQPFVVPGGRFREFYYVSTNETKQNEKKNNTKVKKE